MTGDIIIPKKTVSSFVLGMAATLILLFGLGAVVATTVFNAGGGQISNVGAPTASTDAATKAYVDAAGLNQSWVSIGTDCNSYRCYYDPGEGFLGHTKMTADKVCVDNGYKFATSVNYLKKEEQINCVKWLGSSWSSATTCPYENPLYYYMYYVHCVG